MRVAVLALLTTLVWPAASATTYLVRPDGTGDFQTIQTAIDAAQLGDVIELATGTFTGDGNRAISFGGKAITVRSQNGNPQMCTIDCQSVARGFNFTTGEGSGSVLDGVTILNGLANEGGGMICNHASPRIANCVFFRNRANWLGGALMCDGSSPVLTDCRFEENTADSFGGAIFGAAECHPSLTDCTFLANTVGQGGGGACFDILTRATFTRCRFVRNSTDFTGGGVMSWSATIDFTDCVFSDNTSGPYGMGGGLYDGGTGSGGTLTGCTFSNNRSEEYGGGMYHEGTQVTLTDCTFHGNSAPLGGGFFCFNVYSEPTVTMVNAIFAFSTEGAGVFAWDAASTPTLTCCDIYGNAGGDWVGYIAPQAGVNGNISADPLFCDLGSDDFSLRADSPCAPGGECGLIGAWPVGCEDPQAVGGEVVASGARLWTVPSPFAGGTTIAYRLGPGSGDGISVAIYDVAGRMVRTLQALGITGQLRWDGTDDAGRTLPGGIYLLRLAGGGRTVTERVMRIK